MKKYLFLILAICVFLSLNSFCKGFRHSKAKTKDFIFYPSAPDTPRIQYLASISGSASLHQRSKFNTFVKGPENVLQMAKPYGMSFRNGKLYICDPGIAGLEIIDMDRRKYENFNPSSIQLKSPLNCFADINDYLYIADPGNHAIIVFDSVRNYICKVTDTGVFKPTDVTVYGDQIWVTNPDNHRLNVYDKNTHQLVRYFADDYGAGDDGFLYSPYNLYVKDNKVYITDFGDFRIKEYSMDGKFITSIGSYGTGIGQFVRPKGIACDNDLNLFVVDAGFENVQMFSNDGQLLMFFGGPYKGPGDMWLPAKVVVDYDNTEYFKKYVDPKFDIKYLIIVSNQYGPDKINFYAAVSPRH